MEETVLPKCILFFKRPCRLVKINSVGFIARLSVHAPKTILNFKYCLMFY